MLKQTLIDSFQLQAHPEGGFYKETYRSQDLINSDSNTNIFPNNRNYCTAIYFLIDKGNFSAFHRIKSDEIWHFYTGDALEVIEIDLQGKLIITKVGSKIESGEVFQYMVKAGHWFGSRVVHNGEFSFVGCTVAPGFDFHDFELADRETLTNAFPQHERVIKELTR